MALPLSASSSSNAGRRTVGNAGGDLSDSGARSVGRFDFLDEPPDACATEEEEKEEEDKDDEEEDEEDGT